MYQYLKNSLAYHKNRPFIVLRDISKVMCPEIGAKIKDYQVDCGKLHPEHEAVRFYMLNDAFAKLCAKFDVHEPLSPEVNDVARLYITEGQKIAVRLAYYTLLIITREARHMHSCPAKTNLAVTHGKIFSDFIEGITGHGEPVAADLFKDGKCNMPLGEYCKGIRDVFLSPGAFSSSFGGKPWANIAESLRKVVCGEISFEAFTDVAFTLAHNGGPMFNKGFIFYEQDNTVLFKALDVQRSGQIPQFVAEYHKGGALFSVVGADYVKCSAALGADFGGYVDWYLVEALGSLHKYPKEKAAQLQKYGMPIIPATKAIVQKEKSKFYVSPTAYVTIVKRAA